MMDAFRSHCRQNYAGEFELLFGVSSLDDPAAAAVEQLQAEFPERAIRLIECPERLGTNGKVSTLVQLVAACAVRFSAHQRLRHHGLAALSGAGDGAASRRHAQSGMARPPVGLVTALYRGRAHGTLASRLEALGIATDFQAGVLLSKMIEGGLHYGLGSTLAVRREALEEVGGLAAAGRSPGRRLRAGRARGAGRLSRGAERRSGGDQRPGLRLARLRRSPVALGADGARRAALGLCGPDLHARPGLGAAERAGQRS